MKKFRMTHHIFGKPIEHFTEDSPPEWLVSREYKWFYDKHVMRLEIGENVDTDFRKIERIG